MWMRKWDKDNYGKYLLKGYCQQNKKTLISLFLSEKCILVFSS